MFVQFGPHYPLSVDDLTADWSLSFGSSGALAVPKSITDALSIRSSRRWTHSLAPRTSTHFEFARACLLNQIDNGVWYLIVYGIFGIAIIYAVSIYMCEKVGMDTMRSEEAAVTPFQPEWFTIPIRWGTAVFRIFL
jgi:hypothetical protein